MSLYSEAPDSGVVLFINYRLLPPKIIPSLCSSSYLPLKGTKEASESKLLLLPSPWEILKFEGATRD